MSEDTAWFDVDVERIEYLNRQLESQRTQQRVDRATQGFREGVEFAVRAMVKEITNRHGGYSS